MNTPAKIALSLALVAGSGAAGFALRDLKGGQTPSRAAALRALGIPVAGGLAPETVYRQTFNRITTLYARPVAPKELQWAGLQGLMGSLGDPYTMYMPPKLASRFSEDTTGNFFGVGARLQKDPTGVKAATVFEDGPAYRAGLRKNDVIVAVDGKDVAKTPVDKVVDLIKGPENTFVTLRVIRLGAAAPLDLRIKRGRIVVPTVESTYFADENVGYLQITQESEPTAAQFERELQKLEARPMRGLVIDLRDNPGGLLEIPVEILSRYVENKVVVKMRERNGREEVVRTYAGGVKPFDYKIAILINENTASAAEIFAGAMRDYGKATLVGTHSYGKAAVQNLFPLKDSSSAKVTIARYYLPGGEYIGRKLDEDGVFLSGGLQPQVKVEPDPDKLVEPMDPKTDVQLRKAMDVALGR